MEYNSVCINKIRGRPISLITSIITDRIGRHKVLLLINHNHNKICDILSILKIKTQNIRGFLQAVKNKIIQVRVR